jgi:nucleotidyltransferase substrate binding protein (TIGR01987 family)
MTKKDIRWVQRFSNYIKALLQLSKFKEKEKLNELEEQGLIQAFEYTHELAWTTLKDLLEYRGNKGIYGSKDASRMAFQLGIIENGEIWMAMIQSRDLTSHTYNEDTAEQISTAVLTQYFPEFIKLRNTLAAIASEEQD